MYFLATSNGDISDCNQFNDQSRYTATLRLYTQHAGNSCKLPLQRYNNGLL